MPDTASSYYTPPEEQFQNAPSEEPAGIYNADAYPYGQAPQEGDIAVAPETGGELQAAPEEGEQLALNPPRMPRQPSTPRTPPNYDIPPSERPTAAQKNAISQSQRLGGGQGQGYGQTQRIGLAGLESWAQKNGYESPTVRNEDGSIDQEATDRNAHRLAQWIGSPRQQFQDAPADEKLRILAERGDPNAMKAYVNYLQHDAELSGKERMNLQKMKADVGTITQAINDGAITEEQGYYAVMSRMGLIKSLEARDELAQKKAQSQKLQQQIGMTQQVHASQTAAEQGAGDAWSDWQKKNTRVFSDGSSFVPNPDGKGGTHIKPEIGMKEITDVRNRLKKENGEEASDEKVMEEVNKNHAILKNLRTGQPSTADRQAKLNEYYQAVQDASGGMFSGGSRYLATEKAKRLGAELGFGGGQPVAPAAGPQVAPIAAPQTATIPTIPASKVNETYDRVQAEIQRIKNAEFDKRAARFGGGFSKFD